MREKIEMGRDATDGLDKMRDARCEHADGMEVEDGMEKWGYRWKRQDGPWCQPSSLIGKSPCKLHFMSQMHHCRPDVLHSDSSCCTLAC